MTAFSLLVWLHLLAAVSWVGGMVFLSLVLAPSYRSLAAKPDAGALFRLTARRFRFVVWGAIAVLLGTGPILMASHGWPLVEPRGWPSPLAVKLSLVGIVLAMTLSHDVIVGPRVRALLARPPEERTSRHELVLLASTWIPRSALLLTLAVLLAAVILARL